MHLVEVLLWPLGRALRSRRGDERASIANARQLEADIRLGVSSPSFSAGEPIPAKHCGAFIGENVSPALEWSAPPPGTAQILFVMEDLDVPRAEPGIHTIALLPPIAALAEGELNDPGSARFLPASFGRAKYVGPRPIPGHGTHRYRFHVYALDAVIDPAEGSGTAGLLAAVDGHVLASGSLMGTRTA